jgi:hypothetical protein
MRRPTSVIALDKALQTLPLGPEDAGLLLCDLAAQTERLQQLAAEGGMTHHATHLSDAVKYLSLALTSIRLATLDLAETESE